MTESKRIANASPWVPPHLRLDRLGLPVPPRKPELRLPRFRMKRMRDDLLFINDSEQTLTEVGATSAGVETTDLGPVSYLAKDDAYLYRDVLPGEGVKVDEFDIVYDPDYLIYSIVRIICPELGALQFTVCDKGGMKGEEVLMWKE